MTMRFLTRVSALALTPIFSLSLAQMFLDGDLYSAESFSTYSDLFSKGDYWQDSDDSTLAFNDVVYLADTDTDTDSDFDTDLMIASGCGGENGKVNKLRLRGDANSMCDTWDLPRGSERVKVPDIFQPGDPGIGWLGIEGQAGNGKCVLPPYLQDACCNGRVSTFWTTGPPRVWDSVTECYMSTVNRNLLSSAAAPPAASAFRFG